MNTGTFEALNDSNGCTSEATSSQPGAMWSQLWLRGLKTQPQPPRESLDDGGLDDDLAEEPKVSTGTQISGRAAANRVLCQIIAKRITQARELAGVGQTQAALMVGWKNATQLSLIEQGKRMAPPQVLLALSQTFGVSMDWIFGLDSEPERNSSMAAVNARTRHISELLERNARAVCGAMFQAYRADPTTEIRGIKLVSKIDDLCVAVNRFKAINPELFENSRGSATLLRTARDAAEAGAALGNLLDREARRTELAMQMGRDALEVSAA
jgi:transcriptional regulator with XRE-family HTH domain